MPARVNQHSRRCGTKPGPAQEVLLGMIKRTLNYPINSGPDDSVTQDNGFSDTYTKVKSQADGPYFCNHMLLSNISLPSIITDTNKNYYGSSDVTFDFKDVVTIYDGRIEFQNVCLRNRFSAFSNRVFELNPIIFNIRDVFSIYRNGSPRKIINFKSIYDILSKNKIIISVLSFDFERVADPCIFEELFGFTPAESRLAILLINGRSVIECAEEIGIRISTVREQLSAIFSKTGTSRQPELISMLSRIDLLV